MLPRLLTRCLLRPADVTPRFDGFEVIGTFNPAAIECDGGVALLVRVAERPSETRDGYIALPYWDWQANRLAIDWRRLDEVELADPRIVRLQPSGHLRLTFISWLLVAFSSDGLSIDRVGENAFAPATRYETFGVEDPRLAQFNGRYYFTYVAVSEHGIATALASTADFQSFDRHGIIFCPENKDVILFPEKIDGQYVALHRPNPNAHLTAPEIWIARSTDLIHWGRHGRLLGREAHWATAKIGGGTQPVRTDRGWLALFHGHIARIPSVVTGGSPVDFPQPNDRRAARRHEAPSIGQYAAAAMLLDLNHPEQITGLSPQPIMQAEEDFERHGYLPDIVFPTALIPRGEQVDVYYGAADTATGVTRYRLDDVLATAEPI